MALLNVHLLPSLIEPGSLKSAVAIVVDVLRATTVMTTALDAGARQILPCLEIEEAQRIAAAEPAGTVLLAGERQGVPIEGFDLGNSPPDFTTEWCGGKSIVMTTTNGTRALLASQDAGLVLVAAFRNLQATIDAVIDAKAPAHVVCSGTDGRVSLEDVLLAGAIVDRLVALGMEPANDSALLAHSAWNDSGGSISPERRLQAMSRGRGGRRVQELGYQADLWAAVEMDVSQTVAVLERGPLRVIARTTG